MLNSIKHITPDSKIDIMAQKIKLIFYCNQKNRLKIIRALSKFCKVMKPQRYDAYA